ncbi:MAG: DNA primase [Metamycoplasmataceae bacterium]
MSSSIINNILQKSDIVEVVGEFINLSKVGKNYKGICTVHNDTSPSLSISQEKQFFKCFSCGVSGNVITFLEKFQGMSKKEAIVFLAKKYDINHDEFEYVENSRYNDNQKDIIKVFNDITQKFSYDITFPENEKAIKFLNQRNISPKIQEMFSVGYAKPWNVESYVDFLLKKNNNISTMINASLINDKEKQIISDRIVFPIKNEFGDIVALSSRSLDPEEKVYKYLNSGDSVVFNKSSIIYNFWRAKETGKELYLVEGFMDVIAFARAGLDNAIALMGTSISEIHISKLKNHSVVLFFDSDQAGLKATIKSIFLFMKSKINVDVIKNDSEYDPDEYLNKYGQDKFLNLINQRMAGIEFIYQYLINTVEISNPNNIKPFLAKFNNYLTLCEPIIKSQYSNKISKLLNIDVNEINNIISPSSNKTKYYQENEKKIVINEEKPHTINNTYIFININRLLLGMLKNPNFIEIYLSKNVFLGTTKYVELANYIISKKNSINFTVNEELENKLKEIEKTKNPPETEEEFIETIRNLEKSKLDIKLNQNKSKLRKTIENNPDDNFITKILDSSIKAKNEKQRK